MDSESNRRFETVADKRPHTQTRDCPQCEREIEFWHTSGMSECCPHFYCLDCGSPLFRAQDRDVIRELADEPELVAAVARITESLPACECGGSYAIDGCPVCPDCGFRFVSEATGKQRIIDPHMILVTGAKLQRIPTDQDETQ